ncbi:MAG: sulfate adenylyltransferase [Rhodospirillaceae bacterium]|nr:sulfate adenylyltransferase [Rhodospirillaceae bacterium]MYH35206.1 sulfate adenylyltransferase [Rhodospirillaceae bacterium]MYK12508.1 sulfate adenylyltransferase [Rhodospirillaceae bacterium]
MIAPHGTPRLTPLYVADADERARLAQEAESLPPITVSSAAASNAVMLGGGYFTPLAGFMDKADALSVGRAMRTAGGLFWPTPVLNLVHDAGAAETGARIALRDPNVEGAPVLAVQEVTGVETFSEVEFDGLTAQIYGTTDPAHPGVADFRAQGRVALSGPVRVLNFSYFETDFAETFRTAVSIRNEISQRGWRRVVAFQTRNPMHRAHEELCRIAMERLNADGVVIHMLLGKLKPGDIPAPVRDATIRKMVDLYFPPNTAMITGYGFDMLYAGPREAVLHAIFRQNMGASHFIVGRDHAGVGDYYEPFEAQEIFDDIPDGALQIELFKADHTAWSKKLNKVVMMREAPGHTKEDFILLSGTAVREMLGKGIAPPPEFSRPEVAQILIDYYRGRN